MPQKPLFSRAPMIRVPYCFPANGTVRTEDPRIERLYRKAEEWIDLPCMWEGLFRLACLLRNKPAEEAVTARIYCAIADTENGAFAGTAGEQVSIARAALAVFEYNTDRTILKRIALWLRYFEIEFETLILQDHLLYRPADLMELLIRYYMVSGMKSVLRICTKLRASAFDWTTTLHTFQQSIPISGEETEEQAVFPSCRPDEISYDDKQKMINHAETLADGVRFTFWSGLFSGHGQDLSSGRTVWEYLLRHHRALCGGTTANPFLCGNAADRPVDIRALAAWTEAFASQLAAEETGWALEELIRIVFNGLDDCLNRETLPREQKVNTIRQPGFPADPVPFYARITRAAASAFSHAVALTEKGIRINYMIPLRCLIQDGKQSVILCLDDFSAHFRCKTPFFVPVDLYVSANETAKVIMRKDGKNAVRSRKETDPGSGFLIHTEQEWKNDDGLIMEQDGSIVCERTHHQGVCFIKGRRLLSVKADSNHFAFTVTELPKVENGRVLIRLAETGLWHIRQDEPADIPVLPAAKETSEPAEMSSYAVTAGRITMFPKTETSCLK